MAYCISMVEVATPEDLQRFAVEPGKVFEALNDPKGGVAYVRLDEANPQGLVDCAARWCARSNLQEWLRYARESDMPELPIAQELKRVMGAIGALIQRELPSGENLGRLISVRSLDIAFLAEDYGNARERHTDPLVVTSYLGANVGGHIDELPDGSKLHLGRLEPHHVLLTRQEYWATTGGNESKIAPPIWHWVDWEPTERPFRVSGLSFHDYQKL